MTLKAPLIFQPSVLVYVRRAGETLMLRRDKGPGDLHAGKWNGLGGKVESGENPDQAAVREVREESGLVLIDPLCKGFLCFPGFDGERDWHVHVFLGLCYQGEPWERGPEGTLHWTANDLLPQLNLWEGDRHFLPLLDVPGFFTGTFVYRQGRLQYHQMHHHPV